MYYFLAATAAAAVVAAAVIAAATEATATAAQQNQDDDNNPGTTVVTAHKRCTSKWFQTCARTTFFSRDAALSVFLYHHTQCPYLCDNRRFLRKGQIDKKFENERKQEHS